MSGRAVPSPATVVRLAEAFGVCTDTSGDPVRGSRPQGGPSRRVAPATVPGCRDDQEMTDLAGWLKLERRRDG